MPVSVKIKPTIDVINLDSCWNVIMFSIIILNHVSPSTDPTLQRTARWDESVTRQFRERNPRPGGDDTWPGEHIPVYLWWPRATHVGQGTSQSCQNINQKVFPQDSNQSMLCSWVWRTVHYTPETDEWIWLKLYLSSSFHFVKKPTRHK